MCGAQAWRQSQSTLPIAQTRTRRRADGGRQRPSGRSGDRTRCRAPAYPRTAAAARQEDDGERDSQGRRGDRPRPKVDCALALVARGRPVKPVCDVLGIARSNISERATRPASWHDRRRNRRPVDDHSLLAELRSEITDLPSHGDRRDARTVMMQLQSAFTHYNEVHPHRALKMLSPRMFRQMQSQLSSTPCPE